jgi:hypothetical protein
MTDPRPLPPQSLTHLLSRSVRVCACGHVKGIHAEEGTGKCRNPKCECEKYREKLSLVVDSAA